VLAFAFERRVGGLRGCGLAPAFAKMGLATLAMAPLAWWTAGTLIAHLGTRGVLVQGVTALVAVAAGVGVYLAAAAVLRIDELRILLAAARKRGGAV
jgi:hypothetical protein